MLKEQEPMAAGGYLEVQFKKAAGKQEAIPSLTNCSCSEKRWRWEEGNHPVDQPLWELTPYPTVHPWIIIIINICNGSTTSTTATTTTTTTTTGSERVRHGHGYGDVESIHEEERLIRVRVRVRKLSGAWEKTMDGRKLKLFHFFCFLFLMI